MRQMELSQAVAAKRFGLGISPSAQVPEDAGAWLKAQLAAPDPARFTLPSTWECMASWREDTRHPLPKGQPTRVLSILGEEKRTPAHLGDTDAGAVSRAPGLVLEQPFHRQPDSA